MKDYNINEAINIINAQNPNTLQIVPHLQQRELERDFELNYLIECLLNQIPLSISKTTHNRFKLIYPHETKPTLDLYIIISINDNENITIISAYPKNKNRRQREHGK